MFGETKTFKIIYWDHEVKYGDKRRSTFYEAYNRQDAIYKFHQDYGQDYIVRDCEEMKF